MTRSLNHPILNDLDFHNDRQNHGPLAGFPVEMAAERGSNLLLDYTPIADFFHVRLLDGVEDNLACGFDQVLSFFEGDKAARDDFRLRLELSRAPVDRQDG